LILFHGSLVFFFWKSSTYQGELWYLTRTTTGTGVGSDDGGAWDRATVYVCEGATRVCFFG